MTNTTLAAAIRAPPGDIVQKERSLEEIGLSLSVSCRLGSIKAAAGATPR